MSQALDLASPSPARSLGALAQTQNPELRAQALELARKGLKAAQIAKQTGANVTTVHYWLNAADDAEPLAKTLDLASRFEKAAELFVSLAVKKARKAPFNHLMTAAGIAVDKMQLLRGEPTSITANVDRQELSVTLHSALGELDQADAREPIDVTPEPGP